jgi:hypothetical protein
LALFDPAARNLTQFSACDPVSRSAPVVLGATRLAIMDHSLAVRQPFVSEDGRYILVYDGEIYNYRELRLCRYNSENPGHCVFASILLSIALSYQRFHSSKSKYSATMWMKMDRW